MNFEHALILGLLAKVKGILNTEKDLAEKFYTGRDVLVSFAHCSIPVANAGRRAKPQSLFAE